MGLREFLRKLFSRSHSPPAAEGDAAPSADQSITRWQKALADFGFPYIVVPPQKAGEELEVEDKIGLQQGFTPIIIVPGLWNSTRVSARARLRKVRELPLDAYDAAFGREFLTGEFGRLYEDHEFDPECLDPAVFDALQAIAPKSVPSGLNLLQRYNLETRSMESVPELAIMRIPTTDTHTVPVYLDWGGWNAVPSPLEIVAVSRHWGELYGARLTAIGSDVLEFTVARRPTTHSAAVALLKEQYCFAPDNWENDQQVLEEAAAQLLVSNTWYFWWD
jgi:hypothetical protein